MPESERSDKGEKRERESLSIHLKRIADNGNFWRPQPLSRGKSLLFCILILVNR